MNLLVTTLLLTALPVEDAGSQLDDPGPPPAELAARAQPAATLPPPPPARVEPERAKLLGLQLSAGAPQGFVASAVVRPIPWLRASLGFAHNVLGPGIQGSVTAVPFRSAVSPTLTLEAGRFFETDVSDRLEEFPGVFDASLRDFGYEFYSAQLGLEFGSQRGLLFFLRAGIAWMRSDLDSVQGFRAEGSRTTVDATALELRAAVPTVNLGVTYLVW